VDSGGANLPNQAEVFPDREHFGRIFYNQAQHVGARHRPDRLRDGLVHRRGAYVPAMSDETVIVREQARSFWPGRRW
jgi:3-methylcrotonyl-CoA carboxylase beta subunit